MNRQMSGSNSIEFPHAIARTFRHLVILLVKQMRKESVNET